MFKLLSNVFAKDELITVKTVKRTVKRTVKTVSKTQKVLNLLQSGKDVAWKTLRSKFDLTSPTSMIGKLRNEGHMIYTNKSKAGVSFRMGTPSKAVIAAGQRALFGNTAY